jgi:hypothetical protein
MNDIIEAKDPEGLRLAFEALLPLLNMQGDIRRANTDIHKAFNCAASVGRMVLQPEMRAAFASLPPSFFDILHVDRLEQVALATAYAWLQGGHVAPLSTGAKLPMPNLVEATALKQVMLKVLEYNLGHVGGIATLLASIRPGHGHADLVSDLWRLAVMYEEHAADLIADTRFYQAGDAAKAKKYVQGFNHVLGDGQESDTEYWTDYLGRAWTLLVNTYDEVSAAGRWLFRNANGEERFPSLYAVGRQPRRSRRDGDELPGDELPGDGEIDPEQPES